VQSYLGAKPVYEFLGVEPSLGLHFRAGSHGMTTEDWSALLDFSDQYLLKKGGTKKFDVIPTMDQTP
jgi:endo-1,4-beta-xylanase